MAQNTGTPSDRTPKHFTSSKSPNDRVLENAILKLAKEQDSVPDESIGGRSLIVPGTRAGLHQYGKLSSNANSAPLPLEQGIHHSKYRDQRSKKLTGTEHSIQDQPPKLSCKENEVAPSVMSQAVFPMDSVTSPAVPVVSKKEEFPSVKCITTSGSSENTKHGFSTSPSSDEGTTSPKPKKKYVPQKSNSDNNKIDGPAFASSDSKSKLEESNRPDLLLNNKAAALKPDALSSQNQVPTAGLGAVPPVEQQHVPPGSTSDDGRINNVSNSDSSLNKTSEMHGPPSPANRATPLASESTPSTGYNWQVQGNGETSFKINREEMGRKIMSDNYQKRSSGCCKRTFIAKLKEAINKNSHVEVQSEIHPRSCDEDKYLTLKSNVSIKNFDLTPSDQVFITLTVTVCQENGQEMNRVSDEFPIPHGQKEFPCFLREVLSHDEIFNGFTHREYRCLVEAQLKVKVFSCGFLVWL